MTGVTPRQTGRCKGKCHANLLCVVPNSSDDLTATATTITTTTAATATITTTTITITIAITIAMTITNRRTI